MKKLHMLLGLIVSAACLLVWLKTFGFSEFGGVGYPRDDIERVKWAKAKYCDEETENCIDPQAAGDKQTETSRNLRFWKDRDPFNGAYVARSLNDVLLEMSDYGGGRREADWKRRRYLAEFAAEIIQRDKDHPELLIPKTKPNPALSELIPKVQPYFQYWGSGPMESAPHELIRLLAPITKASVKNMNLSYQWSNIKLIPLDDSNLDEYVTLPDHVMQKRSNYSTTYFSDLLRLELLCNYGGFWADSTFYFDKAMPRDVYEADFFAFKLWHAPAYSSSWFLHSYHKHNPLLLWTRHIMFEYWRTHSTHEYFDFHKFMEIVLQFFPEIRPYYDTMPFYASSRAHAIHRMFQGRFDPDQWTAAKRASWGYKLSYKAKINILPQLRLQAAAATKTLQD